MRDAHQNVIVSNDVIYSRHFHVNFNGFVSLASCVSAANQIPPTLCDTYCDLKHLDEIMRHPNEADMI